MRDDQYGKLLALGRELVGELDFEALLLRVLEVARDVTGARYAALGVLDEDRVQLDRFVVSGLDDEVRRAIGELPRGRGVLGELIRHPQPLRLASVGRHPRSYGFPPGHPPMETFLGAPILIRGVAFGNIYLTEKDHGEFTEDDEAALVVLSDWASVAIENARLHQRLSRRHDELQRAVLALETSTAITRALAGETRLDRVLELIAKRGRAVVEASTLAILLVEGDQLVTASVAGALVDDLENARVPLAGSIAGDAVRTGRAQRLAADRKRLEQFGLGRLGVAAHTGLFVPLVFRGRSIGTLVALDTLDQSEFSDDHLRVLEAFADSAAMAVGTAQSVSDEQRRRSIQATEAERRRWARELHDDTLQELAAIRLALAAARHADSADEQSEVIGWAMDELENRIAALRGLIADVRPAVLDELGLQPAVEALAGRVRNRGLDVQLTVDLDYESGRSEARLEPELEDGLYRMAQEALTNVIRHARTRRVELVLVESAGVVQLSVRDDGAGFASEATTAGFGVLGMRERAELLGGSLEITSEPRQGTEVRATVPARHLGTQAPASAGLV